jgi:hypothetical protein
MPLNLAQIEVLEEKFTESNAIASLPANWKEQALSLSLPAADDRAMAQVLDALANYTPLPDDFVFDDWVGVPGADDIEFRGREIMVPLIHFAMIRQRTQDMLLAALQVEDAIDDEVDRDSLVSMVVNDVATQRNLNKLLTAKTTQKISSSMRALIESASTVYEAVEKIYDPERDETTLEPAISDTGEIMMYTRSTVKIRAVSRSGSPPPQLPPPRVVRRPVKLARTLITNIWQLLAFVVNLTISTNVQTAVLQWVEYYKTDANVTWLAVNYANIKVPNEPRGFLGYNTTRDVPDLTRFIGDNYTGLYGITNPRMKGGYEIHNTILLDYYKVIHQQLNVVSAQMAVRVLGQDNSVMTLVLMAILINSIVHGILRVAVGSLQYIGNLVAARVVGRR